MCCMPSKNTVVVCFLHGSANMNAFVGWVIDCQGCKASQKGGAYSLQSSVACVPLEISDGWAGVNLPG